MVGSEFGRSILWILDGERTGCVRSWIWNKLDAEGKGSVAKNHRQLMQSFVHHPILVSQARPTLKNDTHSFQSGVISSCRTYGGRIDS